jgi:hypothetical protein
MKCLHLIFKIPSLARFKVGDLWITPGLDNSGVVSVGKKGGFSGETAPLNLMLLRPGRVAIRRRASLDRHREHQSALHCVRAIVGAISLLLVGIYGRDIVAPRIDAYPRAGSVGDGGIEHLVYRLEAKKLRQLLQFGRSCPS